MSEASVERYRRCLLRQEQAGGSWENVPIVFSGRRGQRGFGFGSFIKSIGKFILPVAKTIGRKVATQALEVGKDIILKGHDPKEALKTRGKALIKNVLSQQGLGLRKRKLKTTSEWISNKRQRKL